MGLTRQQMREIKSKMAQKNPSGLAAVKAVVKKNKEVVTQKVLKKENFQRKKSIVRWAFQPNELVEINFMYSDTKQIGLIISDFEYFSSRVEKNCFFVFVNSTVKQIDGRHLRKI